MWSSDFVITRMITDRIGVHSVLLPLLIIGIAVKEHVITSYSDMYPKVFLAAGFWDVTEDCMTPQNSAAKETVCLDLL